ncbi:MAG TPA: ATP-binding protein [Acidimicrobiales bacterium]|nr:ATP-binding protein [Acidimicrobiales bacterium]
MSFSRTFPNEPASAAAVRRFVREIVERAPCRVEVDRAVLLASELVANAALHANSEEVRVHVAVAADGVRIAVTDEDPQPFSPRRAAPDDTSGRGMQLVDRLSDGWGMDYFQRSQKSVWFHLRSPAGGVSDPAGPD